MRTLRVALALFAALVLGSADAEPATTDTSVTITVWTKGRKAGTPPKRWTLRCEPPGGTLPQPARACRALLANRGALRPIPPRTICTQIYGGPQEALVAGTVRGRPVWTRFNRRNGCQISRWNRLAQLFPVRV